MNRLLILVALLLTLSLNEVVFAQKNVADSLENALKKYPYSDTTRVNLLNETAIKYYRIDDGKLLNYSTRGVLLSDEIGFDKGKARSLFLCGLYWQSKIELEKSLGYYDSSLVIYYGLDDKASIAKCLNNIGLINKYRGNYSVAMEYYLKSLELAKETNNQRNVSYCLNNIGTIYQKLDDDSLAKVYYGESLVIKQKLNDLHGISANFLNIGNIDLKHFRYKLAIKNFRKSLDLTKQLGDKDGISLCLNNIGAVYLGLDKYDSALYYFNKSVDLKKEIGHEPGICTSYYHIGLIYYNLGDINSALNYTKMSLAIADKYELFDDLESAYNLLSGIYAEKHDYKMAYENYILYKDMNDSIFNKKNIERITSLELQYKYEKERQVLMNEQQRKEAVFLEKVKLHRTIIAAFIVIAFLLLYLFLVKKKTNDVLRNKNKEINKQKTHINEQKKELQSYADKLLQHKQQLEEVVKQQTRSLVIAKENVEKSEEMFRAIAEQTTEGITLADVDGNYVYVNSAFCEMTQYSSSELLKMMIFDMLGNENDNTITSDLFGIPTEFIIKRKDASVFPIQITVNPILIGKTEMFLGMISDITLRKKAEEDLLKAKQKAEESDRLKTSFLNNISHEFRTPMNGILGFSSLLIDSDLSSEDKEIYSEVIDSCCAQLSNIVDDTIEMSKVQSHQVETVHAIVNIKDEIDDLLSEFKVSTELKGLGINVELQLEQEFLFVKTDESKLKRVLWHIINNAIKFTSKGSIDVIVKIDENNNLFFQITDTGIGIESSMHKIVFEPYSQVENGSTRNFGGSGIGLTLSKAFVELMGGKIWLESEVNIGTSVFFSIPVEFTSLEPKKAEIAKTEMISLKTILVVEDNEINYLLLKEMLSEYSIKILHAWNGKEAVDIFTNNKSIDLILMDLKMPVMDGYEAFDKIRKLNSEIPVIAQTAYASSANIKMIKSAGFNDYITKPITKHTLISMLSSFTNK